MQLHNLKRITKNKSTMIVGRGGKRGKTSGRGMKGQNSRSGHKKRPELRDFIKRIPKLRGRGKNSLKTFVDYSAVVNLKKLEKYFEAGAEITPAILIAKKLVRTTNGKTPVVKILGTGTITKKLTISNCVVSKGALIAIEKAGGSIKK